MPLWKWLVDPEGSKSSRSIDTTLKKDAKSQRSHVKILILGPGDSGKSTLIKQLKILFLQGYSRTERAAFIEVIKENLMAGARSILDGAMVLGIPVAETHSQLPDLLDTEEWSDDLVPLLDAFWRDQQVLQLWNRRSEYQVSESAGYFLDNLQRVIAQDYLPTDYDILQTRVRTTGIVEMSFKMGGTVFNMFDVGGQRTERRKWIHCFENVDTVLFCAAISEYDQTLFEDNSTNRVDEAINLLTEVWESPWFSDHSMILFLNKVDLFKEKIQRVDLNICFPDYTGGLDYDNGIKFMRKKFGEINKTPMERSIYTHVTCATDTENIRFVWAVVKAIVIKKNLGEMRM